MYPDILAQHKTIEFTRAADQHRLAKAARSSHSYRMPALPLKGVAVALRTHLTTIVQGHAAIDETVCVNCAA